MSTKKEISKKEIKTLDLALPVALILVAVIVAVILVTSGDGVKNVEEESDVEGTEDVDFGEYADYIEEGIVANIDDDPYLGDIDTAKIAIVEFSEYLCSFCYRHTSEVLPDILSTYVDTGEVIYVFRDFQMYGDVSEEMAEIGMCVNEVAGAEEFAQYHEAVKKAYLENENKDPDIEEEDPDIYTMLDDLGIDSEKVKTCYESGKYEEEIALDYEAGSSIGITGTPGFVVGVLDEDGSVEGFLITGALPFETFQIAIEYLQTEIAK